MEETILIVDDSPLIVDGLSTLLKRKNYKAVTAQGGEECLSLLKTLTPDLILLDIMMEPMDGWETLEKLKADPATRNIPVLMFSAKKISPQEAEEHSMNIDDFVSKPVNPTDLINSIQRIFDRKSDLQKKIGEAVAAGLDRAICNEYAEIRMTLEVDRNLLTILRHSCGIDNPGCNLTETDAEAIKKLEAKVARKEQRLQEISALFARKT